MEESTKNDRRAFLKRATLTSTSFGLMLTAYGASHPAYARLNYKYASAHADQVIKKAIDNQPSHLSTQAFEQTVDNIKNLIFIKKDPLSIAHYKKFEVFLRKLNPYEYGSNTDGLLGLPIEFSNILSGGYLASSKQFHLGAYSENELKRFFKKNKSLEPDFLPIFAKKIQDQQIADINFSNNINRINSELINKELVEANKINTNFQSRFIDPVTLTWVCIGVIVLGIAIWAAIDGEKEQ